MSPRRHAIGAIAAVTLLLATSACTRPPVRPPVDRTRPFRAPAPIEVVLDEHRCETDIETLEVSTLEQTGGARPVTKFPTRNPGFPA
jgi:hypothetical protein